MPSTNTPNHQTKGAVHRGAYRTLPCVLWDTPTFRHLSGSAQNCYVALVLHLPYTGIGVLETCELLPRVGADATIERIEGALQELVEAGYVKRADGVIWVVQALADNNYAALASEQTRRGVQRLIASLPPSGLVEEFRVHYAAWFSDDEGPEGPDDPAGGERRVRERPLAHERVRDDRRGYRGGMDTPSRGYGYTSDICHLSSGSGSGAEFVRGERGPGEGESALATSDTSDTSDTSGVSPARRPRRRSRRIPLRAVLESHPHLARFVAESPRRSGVVTRALGRVVAEPGFDLTDAIAFAAMIDAALAASADGQLPALQIEANLIDWTVRRDERGGLPAVAPRLFRRFLHAVDRESPPGRTTGGSRPRASGGGILKAI